MAQGVAKNQTRLSDFHFTNVAPGLTWVAPSSIKTRAIIPPLSQYRNLSSTWDSRGNLATLQKAKKYLFLLLNLKVKVEIAQLCLTLYNPMGYTVHGILQARILEWVAFPFSKGSSKPRNQTGVSCIAGRFFTN